MRGQPGGLVRAIRMVRTHEWKLVDEPGGTNELYHLDTDPHELVNVYGRAEFAATQRTLENRTVQIVGGG